MEITTDSDLKVPYDQRNYHIHSNIKPEWKPHKDKKLKNFSMIRHIDSCINVYGNSCYGCSSVGADFMITFGSTIDCLDGNNEIKESYNPCHIDVFVTKKQLQHLKEQIDRQLNELS